jgi:hypothetical protein
LNGTPGPVRIPAVPAPLAVPRPPAARALPFDLTGLEGREFRVAESYEVRADILPDTVRQEQDGSLVLRVRVASAYPVRRFGWFDGAYEEFEEVLSFEPGAHRDERIASGRAPLLAVHSTWSLSDVLGVLYEPVVDRTAGTMDATCRVSGRAELEGLRRDILARIVTNTSAGYRVYQYRDVTKKGDPRRRLLAIDWEVRECSLVPIGADPTSSTRGERAHEREPRTETATLWTPTATREAPMDPELDTPANPSATPTATQPGARAAGAPAPAANAPSPTPVSGGPDGASLERERQRNIRSRLDQARIPLGSPLALRLLDGGATSEEATAAILDELTRRDAAAPQTSPAHPVETGASETDTVLRQIEDVLTHRTMRNQLAPNEARELDGRLQGNPFVHRRLLQIGETYLERIHGMRGLDRLSAKDLAGAILHHRHDAPLTTRAGGYHVTSDFASVLANVANKGLQKAYSLTPDTYSDFVVVGTLPDFKQAKRVNLGDAPRLVRKPEGGEVSFGAVSDRGENVQLVTYARGIGVSREAMINDDLSAFSRFPRAFGASSKQLIADLVYSILTGNAALSDGVALFHATHGNLVTGVGNSLAAAGVTALSNVRKLARAQTGIAPGNNESAFFLNLDLVHLRVPEGLETAAQQLVASLQPQQVSNVNPFQSAFRSVKAEPRLGAVSQLAFYMFADPAIIDTIEVDFLEGEQGPVIESRMSWTTDGVEMKCRLDVGVAATEHRGVYKNDGTV